MNTRKYGLMVRVGELTFVMHDESHQQLANQPTPKFFEPWQMLPRRPQIHPIFPAPRHIDTGRLYDVNPTTMDLFSRVGSLKGNFALFEIRRDAYLPYKIAPMGRTPRVEHNVDRCCTNAMPCYAYGWSALAGQDDVNGHLNQTFARIELVATYRDNKAHRWRFESRGKTGGAFCYLEDLTTPILCGPHNLLAFLINRITTRDQRGCITEVGAYPAHLVLHDLYRENMADRGNVFPASCTHIG